MDNARRWLTQVIGRGEPDPAEELTSPPTADEPSTVRAFHLPDGRRAVALGSPIPSREAMGRPPADPLSALGRRDGRGKPYSWSSGPSRFVEQAHELVDVDAQPAEHRSFQAYLPTFEGMNLAQRRWYFWWRREYRAGRRLSTDHAYVLVHAFELINLVGVRDGAEAFDALSALEAAYGRVYPWMLHDLERWIEDLALVHGLEDRLVARWDAKVGDWTSRNVSMRLLARHIGDGFLRMPMPVIGALAKYDVDSTFARAGNQDLFELFVRLSLDGVDTAFRKRTGAGLVERFAPSRSSSATWRPHAFYGAVYAGDQIELEPVADHRYAEQLADRLHGVVKYTDLRLRDETTFKHRLRSVTITKTDAKIVDRLIAEQLPANLQRFGPAKSGGKIAAQAPAPAPIEVTVDLGRVRDLIGESDATRTLLIEAMEGTGGGEPVRREPVAPPTPTLSGGVGFDATQIAALRALLDAADPDAALRRIAAVAGLLPEVLLDGINEAGIDVFHDTILERGQLTPRLYDEYVERVRAMVGG